MITIIETLKELRNEIGVTYQSGYTMTNEEIKEKLSEIISNLTSMDDDMEDRLNKMYHKWQKIDKLTSEVFLTNGDLEDELKENGALTDDVNYYISAVDRKVKRIEEIADEVSEDMQCCGYVLD